LAGNEIFVGVSMFDSYICLGADGRGAGSEKDLSAAVNKTINMKITIDVLFNTTVRRVFLIVFPPIGEDSLLQVDIRIGLVVEENSNALYVIGTRVCLKNI
jgi:hypothetical protein